MKLYNSLTNKKEEFIPINDGEITMYVCGPTVYNYPHIGNMRPVLVFDMMHRYFKYLDYEVKFVSNFTDVDDKIINVALDKGISEETLTNEFIDAYLEEVEKYNCLDIHLRPKVTEYMNQIILYIKNLVDKDYAYIKENNVYFKTSKIEEYGILSNQNLSQLINGARLEIDANKEETSDFILWKNTDIGIKWDSPFGQGRPGWHTECVVMINDIFNSKIDIHGGGIDLKFPHHENEIAQAIVTSSHKIANYWLHNGHINVDGKKMSKSLNNFILSKDLLEKYSSNVIRIAMFKSHYRQPFNLTDDLLSEAINLDNKLNNLLKQIKVLFALNKVDYKPYQTDEVLFDIMNDDFNTANAITYLIDLIKIANNKVRNYSSDLIDIYSKIKGVCFVLGLKINEEELLEEEVKLYTSWQELKQMKKYEEADELYNKLKEKDIV